MTRDVKARKRSFGTTMGVTSIIAILVILILIVFSALSITTSKADLNLSEKTAIATAAYYKADTEAEKMLAKIYEAVNAGSDWIYEVEEIGCKVTQEDNGQLIAYAVKIDENKELLVNLLVTSDGKMSRTEWRVVPTSEWTPDTNLNVVTEFPVR